MTKIGQILEGFLEWLPNWQIGVVLAVLLVLAILRKIRIMLLVGFIISFIWGIAFFSTNRDMVALMGGLYFGIFVGAGVFIILGMIYTFFLRQKL